MHLPSIMQDCLNKNFLFTIQADGKNQEVKFLGAFRSKTGEYFTLDIDDPSEDYDEFEIESKLVTIIPRNG